MMSEDGVSAVKSPWCDNEGMIRAYAPLVGRTFASVWPFAGPLTVFAPGPQERRLTGDDLEVAEYRAMSAAAASIADEALTASSPRAVVAVDLPDAALADAAEVVAGVVMGSAEVDPHLVASVHIDDPDGFAALPEERDSAVSALAGSDLLWFDSAEVDQLIELLAQLGADDRLES